VRGNESGRRQQNLSERGCARTCRRCLRRTFVWTSSNPNSQSGLSLRRLLIAYLVYTLFGSVVFRLLNDRHWNWPQSFYYAITAGLSIGYGAMVPSAPACQFFAIVYVILGACAFSLLLSVFVRKLLLLVPRIAAEEWRYQARLRETSRSPGLMTTSAKVPPRHWLPLALWLALGLWTLLGTIWAHEWQHAEAGKQWSWLRSLFFAVGTVTTAGMVAPQVDRRSHVPTDAAAFLAVYAFVGVPLFGAAVSHAAQKYVELKVRRQQREALRSRISPAHLAAVRELRRGLTAERQCQSSLQSQAARLSAPSLGGETTSEEFQTVKWGDYLSLQLLRLRKVEFDLIKDLRKEYLKASHSRGGLSWSMLDEDVVMEGHLEEGEVDER